MFKIETVNNNNRMSTQALLQQIYAAISKGETEFEINASGQHDIGGPLWNTDGKPLRFLINNPGQRVGMMCMAGTEIVVEGPAPADAGWLNAGGTIVIKGDAGDTTAHCASSGKIFVGGRVGTRSGSLMKYDPKFTRPELWVLKNTGSFSFEFMGGGVAVVCGYGCDDELSVLGDRACAGMVGGTVYFRGKVQGLSEEDSKVVELDAQDEAFLQKGLEEFLEKIGKQAYLAKLSDLSNWKKIVARPFVEKSKEKVLEVKDFRLKSWVPGGIFGDVYADDWYNKGLVDRGDGRLRRPEWENAKYVAPCESNCPAGIPSQTRFNLMRSGRFDEAYKLILEYTPFPASVCGNVCPNLCMQACSRCNVDVPAQIKGLGLLSADIRVDKSARKTGKKVAIIGAGVGGLTAAWVLALRGHEAVVYEQDEITGGKLAQVIPDHRLDKKTLDMELQRIKDAGVEFVTNYTVDKKKFAQLRKQYDAVVISSGAHLPRLLPIKGKEKMIKALDFLKKVNKGQKPKIGKTVVVIGCGNAGMDVISAAYQLGAKKVVGVDIQKPLAFEHELEAVKKLGAEIRYPVFCEEVTAEGIVTKSGELIKADTVIVSVGESPDLGFLPQEFEAKIMRGFLQPDKDLQVAEDVYVIGDVVKQGLLVDAIAQGREVALRLNAVFNNTKYQPRPKPVAVPAETLSLEYFQHCHMDALPSPDKDYKRCISCGTCRDCKMCLESCPEGAIRRVEHKDGTYEYVSESRLCIGCSICKGVCPCGIWQIYENEIQPGVE